MKREGEMMHTKATIRKIAPGTNDIGDRNYTVVLEFSDAEGEQAVGFYTHEKKLLVSENDIVDICYRELSPRELHSRPWKRLMRQFSEFTGERCVYYVSLENEEALEDPNAIYFSKNQYPGDKTTLFYILAGIIAVAIVAVYGRYFL